MKLPAFSGQKRSINLLPKDPFENSSVGIVLTWALAFGKWSVILTQLVVMGAFLWRFTLDRQLTNLRRQIDQQKAIVASYGQVESDFTMAQKRVAYAKNVLVNQEQATQAIQLIQGLTPQDVWYEKLAIAETGVSMTAYSASLSGFSRLLTALQQRPEFAAVNVGTIEDGGANGAKLRFDITLTYGAAKK